MKFTCPKCYETFSVRKGKTSKVKDAASLNEEFEHTCKASLADLARLFLRRRDKPWTRETFHSAIEKKIGVRYSRVHAYATLKKFKMNRPSVIVVDGASHVAFSGSQASVITAHAIEGDSKVKHETVILDPVHETQALKSVRIAKKSTIP